jgi:uncharacterized YigZ family protein
VGSGVASRRAQAAKSRRAKSASSGRNDHFMVAIVGGGQPAINNAHTTLTPRLADAAAVIILCYNEAMKRYPIPARESRAEIRVSNSRFIATVAPVFSVDEAKAFIARIREEFADATHNVPAYVVGHGAAVIAHCNDDGEPAGTAGRPALAVLQGSGLGDVALVVTRYFGGTKLGTGGLVRAYSDVARAVLAQVRLAVKVPTETLMMAVPYSLFEQVRMLAATHRGQILEESFTADVTVIARFAVEQVPGFQAALQELSNGTLVGEIVDRDEATIMPLDEAA